MLMPTNGGAMTTAVKPAAAMITGTSSRSATGLYAHRSVTGRVGNRWEGGDEVRMGIHARIPRGGRYDGTVHARAFAPPARLVRRRPRVVDGAGPGCGRATDGPTLGRRHQGRGNPGSPAPRLRQRDPGRRLGE